jgi:tol-pal system protein YbgF
MKPEIRFFRAVIPLVLGLALSACAVAPQAATADDSSGSGTTTISKQTLVELLQQIQSLQSEVRDLRNQVEIQGHDQDQFRSRMQDLTQDLDRRVRALERVGGGAPATAGPGDATAGGQPSAPLSDAGIKVPDAKEQSAYDAAFQLMKQGDYDNAGNAFRGFIKKYPSSALAPNAQYWIGESNYIQRNFPQALKEFIKVQENYPGSRKAPDAQLKIGYTYYELHEWDKARAFLKEVVKRYPDTLLARSAHTRLDMMQKEGH